MMIAIGAGGVRDVRGIDPFRLPPDENEAGSLTETIPSKPILIGNNMKIYLLSDLHIECSDFVPPPTSADVVILAGDIGLGTTGMTWAKRHFLTPVIYIAGNHEFYASDIDQEPVRFRAAAAELGIHFLDCTTVELHGVRFIGATMWTDYRLDTKNEREVAMAMRHAARSMADFYDIAKGDARFRPADALGLHQKAVAFIEAELSKPFDGKTVVVTHHSPSPQSVHPKYQGDLINGSFSSDLEHLMLGSAAPTLWVHGHTHNSFDYVVNGHTRVVTNPRGYARRYDTGQENDFFNPGLVIDL